MKKIIVTTTINGPTEALKKFADKKDWQLFVVGDEKTPHEQYVDVNCRYICPTEQKDLYPALSKAIGWNCIQRRNIGFIEAYKHGADVMATVDDDNIPYDDWGTDLYVGQTVDCDTYQPEVDMFDPLSVTNVRHLWHRGYPVDYLSHRLNVSYIGKKYVKVLIQADLWDGDPDIDATARMIYRPTVKFNVKGPYCSMALSPFNSQNTFIARDVIPYYAMLPYVGRMDDIWGSYFAQLMFPGSLIYNRASVYQERNKQDVVKNISDELLGYNHTLQLIKQWRNNLSPWAGIGILPQKTIEFFELYRDEFKKMITSVYINTTVRNMTP